VMRRGGREGDDREVGVRAAGAMGETLGGSPPCLVVNALLLTCCDVGQENQSGKGYLHFEIKMLIFLLCSNREYPDFNCRRR
jgi:hypothetical protein